MKHYGHHINAYLSQRDEHERGSLEKETNIRGAFHRMIEKIAGKDFSIIVEKSEKTASQRTIYYDLALQKDGMPWGCVEDKDACDDLQKELISKSRSQYNLDNMIFENGYELLLIQDGKEVGHCQFMQSQIVARYKNTVADLQTFDSLLYQFFTYVPKGARGYAESLAKFQESVPVLAHDIRKEIEFAYASDIAFRDNFNVQLASLQSTISEVLTYTDVEQMLVQHVLTADLFKEILGSDDYVKFNTIAKSMDDLATKLGRNFAHQVATNIRPFYHNLANNIRSMGVGNAFSLEVLRKFYETFYRAYDTKAANYRAYDTKAAKKLGTWYTPTQVVDFMVQMADSLMNEHFGKHIYSKNVHVLDPCVGTGTFMVAVMEYIAQQAKAELEYKFKEELHANELSILAYYIGNIHIELTYHRLAGNPLFTEFGNMCYMDTLDNTWNIEKNAEQVAFDFAITEENAKRVRAQNQKPLMLILGNPPYKANQQNENQKNKNKHYKTVDARIKETYSAASNAQKLKLTDMYVRFIRWASDRLQEEGMVAFITNRSFLDAHGFDGFRKTVYPGDFTHIYCIDLGGDGRKGGMGGNVFGIKTGVAITFFLRAPDSRVPQGIRYMYVGAPESRQEDKFAWLTTHTLYNVHKELSWHHIEPNAKGYWLNQSNSEWASLIPLGDKDNKGKAEAAAIFHLYSLGVATNRDDWMYDRSAQALATKVRYFIDFYTSEVARWAAVPEEDKGTAAIQKERYLDSFVHTRIKWSSTLKPHLVRGTQALFSAEKIVASLYRPFTFLSYYMDTTLSDRLTAQHFNIFPTGARGENLMIMIAHSPQLPFDCHVFDTIGCMDFFGRGGGQCFPLYRYGDDGHRVSNVSPVYRVCGSPMRSHRR
ncbi:MAG: type ISP restriction/modification enzyme [Spirochaetia bacterium]